MKERMYSLLQKQQDGSISSDEQTMLQEYLRTDDGQRMAKAFFALNNALPSSIPSRSLKYGEAHRLRVQIEQRAVGQRRQAQVKQAVWGVAGAVAMLLLVVAAVVQLRPPPLLELDTAVTIPSEQMVAPVTPTPTPVPTPLPTPPSGYQRFDATVWEPQSSRRGSETYSMSIAEVSEGDALFLPLQISESWEFVGASRSGEIVEIAFEQTNLTRKERPIWILSQRRAIGKNTEIPSLYHPYPDSADPNIDDHSEVLTLDELSAVFHTWEFINGSEWTHANVLAWQQDGQQFTLTLIGPLQFSGQALYATANKLILTR